MKFILDFIFENFWTKFLIAVMLSVLCTFSNKIKPLNDKIIVHSLFIILLSLIYFDLSDNFGIILLLISLSILSYDNIL